MDGTEKGRIFAYSPVHNEYEMRIWTTAKAARAWADTDRPLGPIDEAATAGDLLDLLAELDWVE